MHACIHWMVPLPFGVAAEYVMWNVVIYHTYNIIATYTVSHLAI